MPNVVANVPVTERSLPQAVTHHTGELPRLVNIFYHRVPAAVNEFDYITLCIAEIVVGGEA